MVAPISLPKEFEIVAVRVRRTWRGKLVLQIKRSLRTPILSRDDDPVRWKDAGVGFWRDANGNDAEEVTEVSMFLMTGNGKRP